MIQGTVGAMGKIIGADTRGDQAEFSGVGIDTRSLPAGALFVALPGERVDGHNFVQAAADRGAGAALVERFVDCPISQLKCDSAASGFGRLAAHWRSQFDVPVIGVTGSNGKTSVKTMLASILSQQHSVLVTQGNLNNELGVPLTLCGLSGQHEFAVVEMGAGQPGDIAYLADLARPDVALINNAGPAHLERMGDLAGVARTKGEMLRFLASDGIAVLNADDPFFEYWKEQASGRHIISFGLEQPADISARWRSVSSGLEVTFTTLQAQLSANLRCRGEHNVANAAAAVAAAIALGVATEQISMGLEAFEPVDGRLNLHTMKGGWKLLHDAYNANPASMSAGLKVLAEHSGERWLIMGDMRELGSNAPALHFQVGSEAHRLGVQRVFALGELGRHVTAGFGGDQAQHFSELPALVDALVEVLAEALADGQQPVCLLKGSRGMRMERVLESLQALGVA